jgi:hypothetical protein
VRLSINLSGYLNRIKLGGHGGGFNQQRLEGDEDAGGTHEQILDKSEKWYESGVAAKAAEHCVKLTGGTAGLFWLIARTFWLGPASNLPAIPRQLTPVFGGEDQQT